MPRATTPSVSTPQVARRALLLGFAAGLRSATPLGVMAAERNDASFRAGWKNWPMMRSDAGRVLLQMSWAGEIVVDKLPVVPPRTEPGPLAGRLVSGAIAGMAMGTLGCGGGAKLGATLAGIAGGFVGAFGGNAYRTKVTKATGLPDLPVALLEDLAAYLVARKAIKG